MKSKKGISPILATLLLIVIAVAAVIVTYAWVMTFTGSTTSNAGAVLSVENVRYYTEGTTDKVEVVIRNSGTSNAKAVEAYSGTSSSSLMQMSGVDYENSGIIEAGASITITFNLDWTSGNRYYFKVVTEEGISIPFSAEA
ncbi:MAG: archaellin/type IV pilin N-terminal domain-containing protein [Candidatus Bathyarchaeia archaeon]